MFRIWLCALAIVLGPGYSCLAQDSGKSLLSAARKRAADARGKKGEERKTILEDTLRILEMVPERFPKEAPSLARALVETGRVLRRLGRPEEAVSALERAVKVPDENRPACEALHELASLYRKAKQPEKAEAALQAIIDDHPQQALMRARALIRLASSKRSQKKLEEAAECLRRCLKEHGDLWRSAVDAVDALVALKLRAKDNAAARRLLDAHTEALKARFKGTKHELRVGHALQKMKSRARLEKASKAAPAKSGGAG